MPKTFLIILLIAGVVILGVFYVKPQWDTFNSLRADSQDLQSINSELDELIANLNTIGDTITKIDKNDLTRVDQTLPQGQDTANFLVTLESLAIKNGLALRRTDVAAGDNGLAKSSGQPKPSGSIANISSSEALKNFSVTLSVVGQYDAFKGFLRDLEKLPRIADAKEITFNAPVRQGESIEFILQVKTYYQ